MKGFVSNTIECIRGGPLGREPNISFFTSRHMYRLLRVRAFFHKTVRVCYVYCNFKIVFTCRIAVIFGTLKDGSLLINTLASNIFLATETYSKMASTLCQK